MLKFDDVYRRCFEGFSHLKNLSMLKWGAFNSWLEMSFSHLKNLSMLKSTIFS